MNEADRHRRVLDFLKGRPFATVRELGEVVDASVMPRIPRANTNLTCIMLAERVADWMRTEPAPASHTPLLAQ